MERGLIEDHYLWKYDTVEQACVQIKLVKWIAKLSEMEQSLHSFEKTMAAITVRRLELICAWKQQMKWTDMQ